MSVTPDFAKDTASKILLHITAGLVAYIIYKIFSEAAGTRGKGYIGFIIFTVSFFIFLSTFYMPIVANQHTINVNASKVVITIE
jgi:uncharacterized membrane-anchored protein